jgi:hypothetical protein
VTKVRVDGLDCSVYFSVDADEDVLTESSPSSPSSSSSFAASGARGGLFGAGGRFKGGTDPIMEKFNESIGFDKR